ncbi:MAG: hypothetical protein NC311_00050 [Muribaculaceae bacterium]|nr:hypothetical protein [Muribaculaceae bacterium]
MSNRLKNWWLDRGQMFEITANISVSSFAFGITVLDCRLNIELDLAKVLCWMHVFYLFRRHFIWFKKLGGHKTIEAELFCDGALTTGFTFYKHVHCDHTPCRLELAFLGIILGVQYYDGRHWDYDNDTYEIPVDE